MRIERGDVGGVEFDEHLAQVAHDVVGLMGVGPVVEQVGRLGVAVHPLDDHRRLAEAGRVGLVAEAAAHRDVGVHPQRLDQVVLDGPARLEERHGRRRVLAQDQRVRLLAAGRCARRRRSGTSRVSSRRGSVRTRSPRCVPPPGSTARVVRQSSLHDPKAPYRSPRNVARTPGARHRSYGRHPAIGGDGVRSAERHG